MNFKKGSKNKPDIVMSHEIEKAGVFCPSQPATVVHYNMLRAVQNTGKPDASVFQEPVIQQFLKYRNQLRVVVLVAPKSLIESRIKTREWVEPDLRDHGGKIPYPREKMAALLNRVNLTSIYKDFFRFMVHHRIPIAMLDASTPKYRQLKTPREAIQILEE